MSFRETLSRKKELLLEDNFFRPRWYSVFLNPYFIGRRAIFSKIREFAKEIPSEAQVLDVGCGLKPYESFFRVKEYVGIDIEGGGHADVAKKIDRYYDGARIPFVAGSFDSVICTQVLEHANDPETLASECARVLRSGGRLFVSMPFMYPEHEAPYDFRRFTRFEHERLLKKNGFKEIKIQKTTGFFGTFGQLFVISCFEGIPFRSTLLKSVLSIFVFGPILILSLALDFLFRKSGPTMDYTVAATRS